MKTNLIGVFAASLFVGWALLSCQAQDLPKPKFSVKIADEKTLVTDIDSSGAIDPTRRINFSAGGNFYVNVSTLQGQTLHLSHFSQFRINNQTVQPGGPGGRFESVNVPLKKSANGKVRNGTMTVWVMNDLRFTQTIELHPTKAKGPGQKRLMNTALITFTIENKGARSHSVGARVCMDTYVIDNDGCLFAAPTHPGKVLDGIILKDKTLPPYVQMLQRPDLKNPGYISHLTLDMGSRYEKVDRVVLSSLGASFGLWDMNAQPAMGDSAISFYWPTKEIKAGAKRELAYAYGEGIAVAPESEGRFEVALGGSFEPGKVFTISAVVGDPVPGQTLSLELPTGLQRLEGKAVQPVGHLTDYQEYGTVFWKARVVAPGDYPIRIRSSSGVTQTKILTITAVK